MTFHKDVLLANNHGIVCGLGPYATVAARQAQAGLTSADLNKVAYQVVGGVTTLWMIIAVSGGTATWLQINTTADSGGGGVSFTNFATLFTTPYQFMQADYGLVYGTTPKATAGNTSATVLTLGGTTPTTPVSVTVKATNTATVGSGAQFSISFDGGSTFAMTGVALSATPTALTGAGANLTLAASVASSVTNDTWKATAASNTDGSGNSLPYTQGTASQQPVVTVGVNGHVGLLFDGVDDFYGSAYNLAFGAQLWMIVKQVGYTADSFLVASGSGVVQQYVIQDLSTSGVITFGNGTNVSAGSLALGTVGRISLAFNTSTSGTCKVGSNAAVGPTAVGGSSLGTGRGIACQKWNASPNFFANIEVFAVGYFPIATVTSQDAAAATYWGAAI